MKRTLAKAIVVIGEAVIDLLAERIKRRTCRNGSHHRINGSGAYDQRNRSADNFVVVGRRAAKSKRVRRRSISKERQNI